MFEINLKILGTYDLNNPLIFGRLRYSLPYPELFITILKWWVKNIFYIILNILFYKNSVFPKDPPRGLPGSPK